MGDGGPRCAQARPTGVGFVLPAQHSPRTRSAPSGSICASIRSNGRDRRGRTAQLCQGLSRWGNPAPYLLPGLRVWPFILAVRFNLLREQHRSCPVRGAWSAGHHAVGSMSMPTPLARAMVLLGHPCLAQLQTFPRDRDLRTPHWREMWRCTTDREQKLPS